MVSRADRLQMTQLLLQCCPAPLEGALCCMESKTLSIFYTLSHSLTAPPCVQSTYCRAGLDLATVRAGGVRDILLKNAQTKNSYSTVFFNIDQRRNYPETVGRCMSQLNEWINHTRLTADVILRMSAKHVKL